MSEVKFSKEHEWIKLEGEIATIGITKHATEMLGDIVFAELPEKGSSVEKDGTAGVVESTKAASDVYTPVSGEVVDTNQMIVDDPAKINEDPEGAAWFFKLKMKDMSEMDTLMNKADTLNYLGFATRKLGDYENGEKYYLQGLAIDPNHKGINEYLGELYVATNRHNLAVERLEVLKTCNCEEYEDLKAIIAGEKVSKY